MLWAKRYLSILSQNRKGRNPMYDEHVVMSLFYDPRVNRFMDEFGSIRHDIFRFITPGQLMVFKENKDVYVVPDVSNSFLVELIYPDPEYEDE